MRIFKLPLPAIWLTVLYVALISFNLQAQTPLTISGKAVSDNGEALDGVTVALKGTQEATTTISDGTYSLKVPDGRGVLVFSFIGYQPKEVTINSSSSINVSLSLENKSLEQVIVVGYGTQKKRDVTGAVASISEAQIKQVPIVSADQALQGRTSGVQVTQTSGEPGGPISIRVRGGNSINAGNEPLFVLDGYPLSPGSSLSSINPNDIASMEILKDASATAIYGSRGANGVVLITTKRGKVGKPSVTYEMYTGLQQLRRKLPLLDAQQYSELLNEANVNSGSAPVFTPQQIAAFGKGTDWQEELFRTAKITNHQLGVSGGAENVRYALSGNYFNQEGIIINSGFKRYSFRANVDININRKLKVGNSLTLSNSHLSGVETASDGRGVINNALSFTPLSPIYNADGSFNQVDIPQVDVRGNPVARALATTDKSNRSRMLGNAYVEYAVLKNLTLRATIGADLNYSKNNFYIPGTIFEGSSTRGYASVFNDLGSSWLNENTLTYNKIIQDHSLNVVVGTSFQKFNYENALARTQGFSTDVLTFNDLSTGESPQPPTSTSSSNSLLSYLGRINYSFKQKYLFTLTTRMDGSSRFGEGNKFAVFPSGSFGWRLGEETFVKNLDIFSDLKIRVSAGITGSQEIGNYRSLAALGPSRYTFGAGSNYVPRVGFSVNSVSNPDLRWESTRQYDVGLDMAFFNNRLTATIDAYYKSTSDLLLNVPLPFTSGFGTSLQNIGKTENRGIELSVNSQNIAGAFNWATDFNIAANRNKVVDLGNVDFFYAGTTSGGQKYGASGIIQVGQPIGSFIGILADGIFQNQEEVNAHSIKTANGTTTLIQPNAKPGDRRFVDYNNDGTINASDRLIIGKAYPKFYGGITNNFSYKGVELSIFLQGVYGSSILNLVHPELENLTGGNNQLTTVLDRWRPDKPSNIIPRAARVTSAPNLIHSDMVESGSYLRPRNISLAYNLSSNLLSNIKIRSIRVYVSAQNLFTITDYSGYDPEVNSFGQNNLSLNTDYGAYPTSKMFLAGLNIGF